MTFNHEQCKCDENFFLCRYCNDNNGKYIHLLAKLFIKAGENGFQSKFTDFANSSRVFEFQLNIMLSDNQYYTYIFNKKFAKACGYKLEDLGKWCDNGNRPLDYLKEL